MNYLFIINAFNKIWQWILFCESLWLMLVVFKKYFGEEVVYALPYLFLSASAQNNYILKIVLKALISINLPLNNSEKKEDVM